MAEWNPFMEMEALRKEIDRAFQSFGAGSDSARGGAFLPGRGSRQYPLINLLEDKDHVYLEALAPGVDPQSLNVTVTDRRLTLTGEKTRVNGNVSAEAFHRSERSSGRFTRLIDLPVEVDANAIQAEYKNGLLVITLPKAEEAKPKQIKVKVK